MEQLLRNIVLKVGVRSPRTRNIAKHISYSVFYKAGSVIANFLLVPLAINYLNTEKYGIWLTLSSVISWFSFFDIGLGNGLRNKFAEAKSKGKDHLVQAYVSSAYFTIGLVGMLLISIFLIVTQYIDWTIVFNTDRSLRNELSTLLPIVFSFFCLQLILKLITSVYLADQNHSIRNKVQFYTQGFSLLCIWFLTKTSGNSLLIFGTVFSTIPVIILFTINLFAFSRTYRNFAPRLSLWKKEYLNDILGLGLNFFVIQIAALILFSTDNFIISRLFSPQEVVPYNISFKYFSIITMAYTIIITPYWSSFTEAFEKKDYKWIKNSVSNIQKLWFLVPIGLGCMVLLANWFYKIWVGNKVVVPIELSISMALYVSLLTFNMIYVNFINGVGKIKLQLLTSLVSMVINIPLSIYLGKYLGWGPVGVILATCFSLGYSVILRPVQYYKIINNTAEGIWNK